MMVFAQVVESGSMTAAARQLNMSTSAVSQHIQQLERESGVVLLHRSTRKLTLTGVGESVYESCKDMLNAARDAEQKLLAQRDAPVGELRVASPIMFASQHLTKALTPLLLAYPQLGLHLLSDNNPLDLIANRIDLAFRFGESEDSNLIARRVATLSHVLCASPAYLARAGLPAEPEDLKHHQLLILVSRHWPNRFIFSHRHSGEQRDVHLTGRLQCNESQSLAQLNQAGLGIFQRFEVDVQDELADGRLVRVLPDWELPSVPLYAVTTGREAQPAKVRFAIEAIRRYLVARGSHAVQVAGEAD